MQVPNYNKTVDFRYDFFYIIMIQSSTLLSKQRKVARTWRAFITNDLIIGFDWLFFFFFINADIITLVRLLGVSLAFDLHE